MNAPRLQTRARAGPLALEQPRAPGFTARQQGLKIGKDIGSNHVVVQNTRLDLVLWA